MATRFSHCFRTLFKCSSPLVRKLGFPNSFLSKRSTSSYNTRRKFLSTTPNSAQPTFTKAKVEDKNIFLDNLGTIFLSAIGIIIATLVRSYYGSVNRNILRDELEEFSPLDPLEIDDLRTANSEFTADVFRNIMADVLRSFPSGLSTYDDFVSTVRKSMMSLKGEGFTIELGHLLDRVVMAMLKRRGRSGTEELPLDIWLTVLSLALHAPAQDRIDILYSILRHQAEQDRPHGDARSNTVLIDQVIEMVETLQDTCQLVLESQILPSDQKFPAQKYERGTAKQLVAWDNTGPDSSELDVEAFASILKSRSVCAWGECYQIRKFV